MASGIDVKISDLEFKIESWASQTANLRRTINRSIDNLSRNKIKHSNQSRTRIFVSTDDARLDDTQDSIEELDSAYFSPSDRRSNQLIKTESRTATLDQVALRHDVESLHAKNDTAVQELKASQREVESLHAENRENLRNLAKALAELETARRELEASRRETDILRAEVQDNLKNLAKAAGEIDASRLQQETSRRELSSLRSMDQSKAQRLAKLSAEIDSARRELETSRHEIDNLRGEIQENVWNLSKVTGELDAARRDQETSRRQLSALRAEDQSKAQRLTKLSGEMDVNRCELEASRREIESLRVEVQKKEERLSELALKLNAVQQELNSVSRREMDSVSRREVDSLRASNQELVRKLEVTQQELERLRSERELRPPVSKLDESRRGLDSVTQHEVDSLRAEIKEKEQALSGLSERLASVQQALEASRLEAVSLRGDKSIEASRLEAATRADKQKMEQKLDELNMQLDTKQQELAKMQREAAVLRADDKQKEQKLSELNEQLDAARRALEDSRREPLAQREAPVHREAPAQRDLSTAASSTAPSSTAMQDLKAAHLTTFRFRLEMLEQKLNDSAKIDGAEMRLKSDRHNGGHTVENFIDKILGQCREVLQRHEQESLNVYLHDGSYQKIVCEMTDLEKFAISKFEEWLYNKEYSFLQYRFGAHLRTAFRRYVAWLEQQLDKVTSPIDRKRKALQICRLRGLIAEGIDEENDLKENRLISAAAEGRSPAELGYLVEAGIDIDGKRKPDGVTAIWVAAQFGHMQSIRKLAELGANLNLSASNGATPAYTAAQSGHSQCVNLLASLKADVTKPDDKGLTPMHQAAMNGHDDCVLTLSRLGCQVLIKSSDGKTPLDVASNEKCRIRIGEIMKSNSKVAPLDSGRPLIITTGDISDIDGFFALAEYAKTDSDVLFIMNYPAYCGLDDDEAFQELDPGKGYRFGPKVVAERNKDKSYIEFMKRYEDLSSFREKMKNAMTDVAFYMCQKIWQERGDMKGDCYFCIGGINSVNPFSSTAIKNEVLEYCDLLPAKDRKLPTIEGVVLDLEHVPRRLDYSKYSDIFLDFNGSMAFLDTVWIDRLRQPPFSEKLRAVVVMGGVLADETPLTMPSITNVLNRFSSATMNQLYHPARSADLFRFLSETAGKVSVYTVTNNVIHDLSMDPNEREERTYRGVEQFMVANDLQSKHLKEFTKAHFTSDHKPARKLHDFYVARVLLQVMKEVTGSATEVEKKKKADQAVPYAEKRLFYCKEFGITLVSLPNMSWDSALATYVSKIDIDMKADDNHQVRQKKDNFQREIGQMQNLSALPYLSVRDLKFDLDENKKLTIARNSSKAWPGSSDPLGRPYL